MNERPGILALEDGTIFEGIGFGARATVCGEAVFNTSITGYQEILTDPSYKGQIVAMTYTQIGNYGVNSADVESWRPHVGGFVIRELCRKPSNWRSEASLDEYLAKHEIPGLYGVDTRLLTSKLRVEGAMKACLSTEGISGKEAVDRARAWHGIVGVDYVCEVTHGKPFVWDEDGSKSARWVVERDASGQIRYHRPTVPADIPVVAIDYGVKYNILRSLRRQGFRVQVVPARSTAEEVMSYRPWGVLLSNGPGDPEALDYAHRAVRELLGQVPIFGICLGHQILGFAVGGRTFKLKFGHRGGNHPVKDLASGKVAITSQNHGFAVDPASLPSDVEITQVNLYDKTVEGLRHKRYPAFSVQYHPEASPGPHDTDELFAKFRRLIETRSLS
ncbi:MAG: glutamine-hydrolyzing carbamoyl-phosphate synthase small subunit [Verrucomicrobiae bacterium]|nr:glutamine-hydrolyzing carbamoyl-phosphate synthase small subunit [Verrucomicrobiae bacterium]